MRSRVCVRNFRRAFTVTPRIGFVGSAGIMGEGMSACLCKAGFDILIWNRNESKSRLQLERSEGKMQIATSPSALAESSDIIFSMLPTPEAAKDVFPLLLDGVSSGKGLVDCATLQANDMVEMSEEWSSRGGRFLEAPVSGSKGPAAQGSLVFLTAGSESLSQDVTKYLDVMGKKTFYFGKDIGQGTRMKLIVNKLMVEMMASFGEGLSLAESVGLDNMDLVNVLAEGAMANPMFALKGPKICNNDHAPHFPLKHANKDLLFGNALAAQFGADKTMGSAAAKVIENAVQQDPSRKEDDFSALTFGCKILK